MFFSWKEKQSREEMKEGRLPEVLIPCRALWGSWVQGLEVPHFFDCRKQPSFRKRLLTREGRGCETREKQSRAALEQSPVSTSRDTHSNIFELFCRY